MEAGLSFSRKIVTGACLFVLRQSSGHAKFEHKFYFTLFSSLPINSPNGSVGENGTRTVVIIPLLKRCDELEVRWC